MFGMDLALLYRFGFLCVLKGEEYEGDEVWRALKTTWLRREVGDFVIWLHPETNVSAHSEGSRQALVIGDAIGVGQRATTPLASAAASLADGELPALLYDYTGRFALFVFDGGAAKVFHDPIGSRTVFYAASGPLAVASHYGLIGRAQRRALRPDIAELTSSEAFLRRRPRYLPGDDTSLEGVYQLIPNNMLDLSRRRSVRYWPVKRKERVGFAEIAVEFDKYFEAFSGFLRGKDVFVSITGGIDSRTVLSGLMHYGVVPHGVTWTDYNFKDEERPYIDKVTDLLGLAHDYIDDGSYRPNAITQVALENAGEFRKGSGVVTAMHDLYHSRNSTVYVRGYGGEVIRGSKYLAREIMRGTSLKDMVAAYMKGTRKAYRDDARYRKIITDSYEGYRARVSIPDCAGLGFDPNDVFYWEKRIGTWGSHMMNEMDPAMYSMSGFNSRRIFEMAFGLPAEVRVPEGKPKDLLRRVMEHFHPGLGQLPYSSGNW